MFPTKVGGALMGNGHTAAGAPHIGDDSWYHAPIHDEVLGGIYYCHSLISLVYAYGERQSHSLDSNTAEKNAAHMA